MVSLVAAMGGLLFGYDWVVIGGAKPFFEKYFELNTDALSGWANSCALLGCLLGSIISGVLSDRFGRKPLLLACGLLFAVSSVFTGWSHTFTMFVVWRIAGGVAIGMASNLSPLYIAEIAPARLRGRLVSMNQLTIVIGILVAQVVNLLIAESVPKDATAEFIRQSWNGQYGWRWMFTAVAVPSVIFFLGSLFLPESPRWLVKRGRDEQARRILARVGGAEHAQTELRDIQATLAREEMARLRVAELLQPGILRLLILGSVLAVLQQWSAINVFFNYAEDIFGAAGYKVGDILSNIVITGGINLVFTFVAIGTVDRLGRRPLMLLGFAGIAIMHLLLGGAFLFKAPGPVVVGCTLGAISCYAMTVAPIVWVLIAEIFPNRVRGAAVSVAVSALWIACFLLTYTFPTLKSTLGLAGTFWTYAAICAAGFVFVWFLVPETKGKTLEEIETSWNKG
ncbi:MAG: sugar porter family MFS transporter [Pirellulales bacterium]|nr:sugar porter family MFS transporter [Pirellulales bacterium]